KTTHQEQQRGPNGTLPAAENRPRRHRGAGPAGCVGAHLHALENLASRRWRGAATQAGQYAALQPAGIGATHRELASDRLVDGAPGGLAPGAAVVAAEQRAVAGAAGARPAAGRPPARLATTGGGACAEKGVAA